MRQRADRHRGNFRKVVGAEDPDDILRADRDIGELAFGCPGDVNVVGDRPGVDRLEHREGRLGIEDHDPADVLERQPYLLAVRRGGDVRAERAVLLHTANDAL